MDFHGRPVCGPAGTGGCRIWAGAGVRGIAGTDPRTAGSVPWGASGRRFRLALGGAPVFKGKNHRVTIRQPVPLAYPAIGAQDDRKAPVNFPAEPREKRRGVSIVPEFAWSIGAEDAGEGPAVRRIHPCARDVGRLVRRVHRGLADAGLLDVPILKLL